MEIVLGFLGSILYIHSVVGGFVNLIDDIYGVRTSLFLTSQRMPSRYGCVHTHIQSNKSSLLKMFIGDIFDSIFYRYSVVGVNIYSMHSKMGVRTHSAVTLRMRTHAYTIM